jgi:hypothetical protein
MIGPILLYGLGGMVLFMMGTLVGALAERESRKESGGDY